MVEELHTDFSGDINLHPLLSTDSETEITKYLSGTQSSDFADFVDILPDELNSLGSLASLGSDHLDKPPNLDEFENPHFNFEVSVPRQESGKNTWMYSSELKKSYIKMNKTFIVKISYNNFFVNNADQLLYVRIMPIFVAAEEQLNPVNRCLNHQGAGADDQRSHIMICKQPPEHTYEGVPSAYIYRDRLSIRIPMKYGENRVEESVGLEFLCQNSCASGINRRCTALIFALETQTGEVYGKRVMQFKICSCPKRDMDKEENQNKIGPEKRSGTAGGGSRKKILRAVIKQERCSPPPDTNVKGIPLQLFLPDRECVRQVREAAINAIGSYMSDNFDKSETRQVWEPYRNTLKEQKN